MRHPKKVWYEELNRLLPKNRYVTHREMKRFKRQAEINLNEKYFTQGITRFRKKNVVSRNVEIRVLGYNNWLKTYGFNVKGKKK